MMFNLNKTQGFLFYLLVFLLPWQTRWIIRDPLISGGVWEYGRVSLYAWDIVLVILLLISLPKIWLKIKNLKGDFEILKNPFFIYFLLLLFTLTSISWAQDKLLAAVWVGRILEGGLIWFLWKTLQPKLNNVLLSLSLAGTAQALWAIGQFITQATFASKWLGVAVHPIMQYGTSVVLTDAGRWLRAYGGQVHPNVLGGLLVITCLATACLVIKNYKFKILSFKLNYSCLLLLLYIIQVVGLFFTFSRGAWLALLVSLIAWLISSGRKNIRPRTINIRGKPDQNLPNGELGLVNEKSYFAQQLLPILGYTFLVFVTLGVILWQPTMGRILGGSRLEVKSVEERVTSVSDSRLVMANHWLSGVSIGNYTYALQQLVPHQPANYYQPVHNVFLLILAELGIVGLMLILWLIKRMAFSSQFIVYDSLFLIPLLITSLFDHYWWTIPSMFLLWWLVLNITQEMKNPGS